MFLLQTAHVPTHNVLWQRAQYLWQLQASDQKMLHLLKANT
jgi:hypothetical protein